MSDLPAGWEWATAGEVAEIILGQSPPGSSYNDAAEGVPFFQGKAEFGELYPTVTKWTRAPKKFAEPNDVLISVRAPVGPTNIAPAACAIGRGLAALRETSAVGHRYLLWAMRATAGTLAGKATGSTFAAVSGAQLRDHRLPLAPRTEQERIVAAIEGHLSRLDAALAGTARAIHRVRGLKTQIIDAAMSLAGESATLDSYAAPGGITDGPFGSKLKSSHYTPDGPRVVRLENIGVGDFIDEQTHISTEYFEELKKHEAVGGDIVVASLVSERLRACIVPMGLGPAIVKADCIRVRLSHGTDSRFVKYALMRSSLDDFVAENVRGVGRSRLGLTNVRRIPVPLADPNVQHRIANGLDEKLAVLACVKRQGDEALRRATALRRAVLAAAFCGQLVPQDPGDEPASVLLERIRDERAATTANRRGRAQGTSGEPSVAASRHAKPMRPTRTEGRP